MTLISQRREYIIYVMEVRIDKIFLHVGDLDRAKKFYGEILGLSRTDVFEGDIAFDLNGAELILVPDRERGSPRTGADICLWADDIDRLYGQLILKGVKFFKPPAREKWGGKLAGCYDSEGNRIFIIQY